MTAHAMTGDLEKSLEAGMNDHVTKPFQPQALYATLVRWIFPDAQQANVGTAIPADPTSATPGTTLPVISVETGLTLFGGNRDLYLRILRTFAAHEVGTAQKMRTALESGDIPTVGAIAHSLKGSSGTIGAQGLQFAAEALELSVKQGELLGLDEKVDAITLSLNQVLDAIAEMAIEETALPDTHAVKGNAVDMSALADAIQHLAQLLAAHDPQAGKVLESIRESGLTDELDNNLAQLGQMVRKYDFADALVMLYTIDTQWTHAL